MLTAAVRDLHLAYPGRFLTDVRTHWDDLWVHNSNVTRLNSIDHAVTEIDCAYPLIEFSNSLPYHFLHGFQHFLNRELGLAIQPTAFRGDIHLSHEELHLPALGRGRFGRELPYWLIVAGGKVDFTIKWWEYRRYQQVVDAFHKRILFVQVGHRNDVHRALERVVDLRGKTTVRELVLLVHHAQGVLCPVTGVMHLSAAVPTPDGEFSRPCVVIAGGREPPHWEAYPHHQFIHTIGMLPCCATGGCWRSRVTALEDGSEHDKPHNLCASVTGSLPACMDQISAAQVIERIRGYFDGGALRYLGSAEAALIQSLMR